MASKNKSNLLLPALLLFVLFSISQGTTPGTASIRQRFLEAEKLYDDATRLASSANYSEEKEAALNRQALVIYTALLQEWPPSSPSLDTIRYWCQFKSGELHHYFEEMDQALQGYAASILTVQKARLPDSLLFRPYLYSGILQYNRNRYDDAVRSFGLAESILKQHDYRLQESERLYNTFGVLYYEKGDYRQAGNYFKKALDILPESHPYYRDLYVNYQVNLAQVYFKLEEYDAANKIYQSLLSLRISTNEIYHNLGLINLYLGATEKSIDYFRRVQYQSAKRVWLYSNMGEAFLNQDQLDSAAWWLNKAMDASVELGTATDHVAYGLAKKNYGDLLQQRDSLQQALHYYQRAMHQFYPSFNAGSYEKNPDDFSGVFSYINLFNTMVAKAECLHALYTKTSELHWAQKELDTYQSAFRLVSYVEKTYESDEARLFLDKTKYIIHSKPIDIAYHLYQKTGDLQYVEQLYYLDQQNKASILAIRRHLSDASGKDSVLVQEERQVKADISRLTLKAAVMTDSQAVAGISQQVRDLEIRLGKIQESLKDHAAYTEQIPTISQLQNDILEEGSALLSLHLSDTRLTKVLIRDDSMHCRQENLPAGFYDSLQHLLSAFRDPHTVVSTSQLYQLVLQGLPLEGINRMIIIPDDELNYLPFEALQDANGNYLVQQLSVQYQYTTALLKKEKIRFAHHNTLAMAPFASRDYRDSIHAFAALPNSGDEISRTQGAHFLDTAATKTRFLQNVTGYPVLHLATHAIVHNRQDNLSFIAFMPGKNSPDYLLYAEEIYNLPLQDTRLVILSACETGAGTLVRGEGVMSLSRAFTYAGCPNIVTSLWLANDLSTAYIAAKLHYYLNKNEPVDLALYHAKQDYLSDRSISPRMKHPYYWSHLVFIGNYGVGKKDVPIWWWLAGGLLLLAAVMVFIKQFRAKRNRTFHR